MLIRDLSRHVFANAYIIQEKCSIFSVPLLSFSTVEIIIRKGSASENKLTLKKIYGAVKYTHVLIQS